MTECFKYATKYLENLVAHLTILIKFFENISLKYIIVKSTCGKVNKIKIRVSSTLFSSKQFFFQHKCFFDFSYISSIKLSHLRKY